MGVLHLISSYDRYKVAVGKSFLVVRMRDRGNDRKKNWLGGSQELWGLKSCYVCLALGQRIQGASYVLAEGC